MSAKAFALWEAVKGLGGLFGIGGGDGGVGVKDIPLTQQVASMLDPLSDEATLLPADAAIRAIKGADADRYINALAAINASLVPHQREQWRKVVAKHQLTERFEQVLVSRKTTRSAGGQDDQGQPDPQAHNNNRRRGGNQPREETLEQFDRRQRDYEWTPDDPRVQHYVLVADLYLGAKASVAGTAEEKERAALAVARNYLLAKNYIAEKSLTEIGLEKADKTKESAVDGVYAGILSLQLGETYAEIDAMVGVDDETKRRFLIAASKMKRAEMRREVDRIKARPYPSGFWFTVGVLLMGILLIGTYLVTNSGG